MNITGHTHLAGLIGNPVIYSLSPALHNAAFQHLQLPYVYLAFHVEKEHIRAAIEAVRAFNMLGVNITVPHKQAVIPYLDRMDQTARRCGAVNTIVNREGTLTGYNTDGLGFVDSLLEAGFDPQNKHVVILGAGGSARAVAASLLDSRVDSITLINRTEEKARQLCDILNAPGRVTFLPLLPKTVPDTPKADLVVNTLSIPFKTEGEWLLDLSGLRGALFYDLRYGKMPSDFLDYAEELKSPGVDGLGMLLHQGARAFTLFTGKQAPVEIMRGALKELP